MVSSWGGNLMPLSLAMLILRLSSFYRREKLQSMEVAFLRLQSRLLSSSHRAQGKTMSMFVCSALPHTFLFNAHMKILRPLTTLGWEGNRVLIKS